MNEKNWRSNEYIQRFSEIHKYFRNEKVLITKLECPLDVYQIESKTFTGYMCRGPEDFGFVQLGGVEMMKQFVLRDLVSIDSYIAPDKTFARWAYLCLLFGQKMDELVKLGCVVKDGRIVLPKAGVCASKGTDLEKFKNVKLAPTHATILYKYLVDHQSEIMASDPIAVCDELYQASCRNSDPVLRRVFLATVVIEKGLYEKDNDSKSVKPPWHAALTSRFF